MKELSLNILDITENSVTAGAKNISISLVQNAEGILSLDIEDDGSGMSEEMVANVTDPFCTSRKTRKVGLGIPLLKLAAEQTGGDFSIDSKLGIGTKVHSSFDTKSIDFTPVGDMVSTMLTLIQGSPEIDFEYLYEVPNGKVSLSTKELRAVLGDVSLASPDVLVWIKEYLNEQYSNLGGNIQ